MPSRADAEAQQASVDKKSDETAGSILGKDKPASTGLDLNPGDFVDEGDKEM